MSGKVLQLELSEKLKPIWITERCAWLRILARYHGRPIGWLSIDNARRCPMISADQLREAVETQLQWRLAHGLLEDWLKNSVQETTSPAISVVICTHDRADQVAGCLETILALDYPCYEVIVIDNAPSNEDTANLVAPLPVRYVREDRPGLDWARNRGIDEARHNIIAFTDDDVRVDRGWLRAIGSAFSEPDVMAVTGLIAPAELESDAQHLFEFVYGGMGKGMSRRTFRLKGLTPRELLGAHAFGVGANMAYRREVFRVIGNFDVALDVGTPTGGAGDLDMFHRLVAKGFTLVYEPAALVWHIHRRFYTLLRQQLHDNGRSFGAYLLTCARNRTISRISVLHFAIWDWLGWWLLRRLLRPCGLSRRMIMAELLGALRSPIAYMAAQAHARKIATRFRTEPKDRTVNLSVRLDPKPDVEEFVSIRPPEAPVSVQAFIERLDK